MRVLARRFAQVQLNSRKVSLKGIGCSIKGQILEVKLKVSEVPLVFKYTLVLLVSSFLLGQSWLHAPASAAEVVSMDQLVVTCPAIGAQAADVEVSRYDAIALRDAFWRAKIKDVAVNVAGGESDACAS